MKEMFLNEIATVQDGNYTIYVKICSGFADWCWENYCTAVYDWMMKQRKDFIHEIGLGYGKVGDYIIKYGRETRNIVKIFKGVELEFPQNLNVTLEVGLYDGPEVKASLSPSKEAEKPVFDWEEIAKQLCLPVSSIDSFIKSKQHLTI